MQLDRGQAVHRPQQFPRDHRRAGIEAQPPVGIDRADRREIGRQRRGEPLRQGARRKIGPEQPPDPARPLARLGGERRGEVVEPDPGMRVEHAERLLLRLQMLDDERQQRMLDDIREIPGVIGVAVVHEAGSRPKPACLDSGNRWMGRAWRRLSASRVAC